jgi:hypothetical protein
MTKTTEEKLNAVRRRRLDLSNPDVCESPIENDPHRPELAVFAGLDEDGGQPHITLGIMGLWGQPTRFVDLHLDEARQLARLLMETAALVDHIVAGASGALTFSQAAEALIAEKKGGAS